MKKWVSGGLFALLAVITLIEMITSIRYASAMSVIIDLLQIAAVALIAAGLFSGMRMLTMIGGGLMALTQVYYILFVNLRSIFNGFPGAFFYILTNLLVLLAFLAVAFLPIAKKSAPIAGFVAGGLYLLRMILLPVRNQIIYGSVGLVWSFWLYSIVFIAAAVLAGLYYVTVESAPVAGASAGAPGAYPYRAPMPNGYAAPNANPYGAPAVNPYGNPQTPPPAYPNAQSGYPQYPNMQQANSNLQQPYAAPQQSYSQPMQQPVQPNDSEHSV